MPQISGSVGRGGDNRPADVVTVQELLNGHVVALGLPALEIDGDVGENTIKTIRAYQRIVVGLASPDGRIDVNGRTWSALSGNVAVTPPTAPTSGSALSGAAWWHANQASFPNSNKLAELSSPFRERAVAFIDALRNAGAKVHVTSTLRNPTRAYLMHFSWKIAKGQIAANSVPPKAGCQIVWDHGSAANSRAAARDMVQLFGMAHPAALQGLHISGQAIDMNISWSGNLSVKDSNGVTHVIGAPRNGKQNAKLHAVGATYGVRKLVSDPPHWSSTGH